MSEIYFPEFFRLRDSKINERDQRIAQLQTELSNADWINEQSRKEIDRLNEQIRSTYIGDERSEVAAELRLDLAKARAEIHRLNGLLDKREESAYTAMSEREKAEELRNELAQLNADYEQLMMYYSSQRGSSRHMEAHVESLKEDLSAARGQRDQLQKKNDELINQLEDIINNNDKE